jgi:rod shape-determining protein MreD
MMTGGTGKRLSIPVRVPDPVRLAGLLLAGVMLQTVMTSRLDFMDVVPDVFLVLVVVVAIGRGALTGAVFGFAAGFVADIVFLDPVGLRTFVSLLAGYAVGRYSDEMGIGSGWMLIFLVGGVAFATQAGYGLLQFVLGHPSSFLGMVWSQMLPASLLHGLLAPPAYLGLVRLGLLPPLQGPNHSFRR